MLVHLLNLRTSLQDNLANTLERCVFEFMVEAVGPLLVLVVAVLLAQPKELAPAQ